MLPLPFLAKERGLPRERGRPTTNICLDSPFGACSSQRERLSIKGQEDNSLFIQSLGPNSMESGDEKIILINRESDGNRITRNNSDAR